ncbi:hypothetical protein M0804_001660 [Polistes exclamans]|nr:hypothetical protein M0804_001660 [Polistes exclamans]
MSDEKSKNDDDEDDDDDDDDVSKSQPAIKGNREGTDTTHDFFLSSWINSTVSVLTISSDLPTVLTVLNEVVPNLEEVSINN